MPLTLRIEQDDLAGPFTFSDGEGAAGLRVDGFRFVRSHNSYF